MFLDFDLLNGFLYLFSFFLSLKLHSFCFMVCFRDVGFFGSEIFVDCLLVLHSTLSLSLSPLPSLPLSRLGYGGFSVTLFFITNLKVLACLGVVYSFSFQI